VISITDVKTALNRDLARYHRLWTAVVKNSDRLRSADGFGPLTQAEVAKAVSADPAVVSRLMSAKELPRHLNLLLEVAKTYQASEAETRTLLVLAHAIIAEQNDSPELAGLYASMFEPLFAATSFADKINSIQNVIFNTLVDVGLSKDAAIELVNEIGTPNSPHEALGALITAIGDSTQRECKQVMTDLPRLLDRTKTYTELAVLDFNAPSRERIDRVILRYNRKQKGIKHSSWALPKVLLTQIDLGKNQCVRDASHPGFEFLFLSEGDGVFSMKSVGDVTLSYNGPSIVAYRPTHPHHFTAGADGARLFVVSYLRRDKNDVDAIKQVIETAENDIYASKPRKNAL
jgi:hypothetical protein